MSAESGRVVATLAVKEPPAYHGPYPPFSKPEEVACFSRDEDRKVHFDRRALQTFRAPVLPADLGEGFDSFVPKAHEPDEPAPLGDVLAAITHRSVQQRPGTIVTFRNNLNKLLATPYSRADEWEMGVVPQPDGTVQLHVRDTARKRAEEAARDERARRMCYWGYRFEQLCTLSSRDAERLQRAKSGGDDGDAYRVPSPSDAGSYDHLYSASELALLKVRYPATDGGGAARDGGSDWKLPAVNANSEFCSVVKLSLGGIRMLMAAEIDCQAFSGEGAAARGGYVELKTSKEVGSTREAHNFEKHKLLKYWIQSYLAGVPSVVVGWRDEAGSVKRLENFEVMGMHRAPRQKGMWDPVVCLNFAKAALEWLAEALRADSDLGGGADAGYVMRYDSAAGVLELRKAAEGGASPGEAPAAKRARSE